MTSTQKEKKGSQSNIIILFIIGAIVLLITTFLVIRYLNNRPPYPDGTYEVTVEDTIILVESNPDRQLFLVPESVGTGGQAETTQSPEQVSEEAVVIQEGTPVTPTPVTLTPVTPTPGTPGVTPTSIPPSNDYLFVDYTVVTGDTIYSIANDPKFNTTIALMARFGISAQNIYPGNIIKIPVANPNKCPGNFAYVVREGDTLSSISIKCKTTVETLKQLNNMGDNYRLDETAVICVPNPP